MTPSAGDLAAANRRGMAAMVIAMTCFVLNDTLTKLSSESLPSTQIMAVRGVFSTAAILAILIFNGQLRKLPLLLGPWPLIRCVLEAIVAALFITALAKVSLGMITAILQVAPLALTALSVIILKERVGWRRWAAVVVGFLGVLLIVRPVADGVNIYAWLAIACAIMVAFRELSTRRVPLAMPTMVMTLGTTSAVMFAGFGAMGLQEWQPMTATSMLELFGAGLFVAAGNWFILTAYRGTEVSAVGPFRYSVVVVALVMGFVAFGEVPDTLAIIGTLIVIASGLYAAQQEMAKRRKVMAAMSKPGAGLR